METGFGTKEKLRIGEILIREGLVNMQQINEAVKVQRRTKRRLGSILVELGHIDTKKLLDCLGNQYGIETADLRKSRINYSSLKIIPGNKLTEHKVIPLEENGTNLSLGMVNPKDTNAIKEMECLLGYSIRPVLVLDSQMDKALAIIENQNRGRKVLQLKIGPHKETTKGT